MLTEVGRVILRNPMVGNGSPKRESGYRPVITYMRPKAADDPQSWPQVVRVYQTGPLLPSERDALNWRGMRS